ncbi:hypothetical protein FFLO_04894 [Filobasidium floriforme]|uniref:Ribosomal protein n=1 Tax=Filobasidium floriforme TaxID=5210 RepID=A0A8K0NNT4_9TREE|nr:hypothetical protein FFLO_04894 [Filobasidium floriforme]
MSLPTFLVGSCRTAISSTSSARIQTVRRTFASSSVTLAKRVKGPIINPDAMPIRDAASVLKALESDRPDNAFEIEIITRVDKSAPPLRGRVSLPRDVRRKEEVVLVFAEGDLATLALSAGATHVGGEELCAQVLSGEIQPTKVICTPSLLSTITPKVGRFLGPKGLMPNPKRGTVREDMDVAVQEAKGLMDWREDRQGHVRAALSQIHFPTQDVEANIKHFIKEVRQTQSRNASETSKPQKGPSITRVSLGSTQGPSIELKEY